MSSPVQPGTKVDDRLRRIESVTETTLAYLSVEELLDELLDRVRELLDGDTAAVLLLDTASGQLVATAAKGIEEEVRQGVRIPLGKGFAGRIAAERRPVSIELVDHSNVLNPILREKGIRSLLGVPLIAGGTLVGIMHVGTLHPRLFTAEDVSLMQLVADRVALAVQARLSAAEMASAVVLQRGLLPGALPAVPGIELGARYVPGHAGGVGGDWYDVFTLPSGDLGVVIGDVVGRGLRAAVVMGRLRSALRAYALESDGPAEALIRLDRMMLHFEPEVMATALYAVTDPSFERLHVSVAGHLAPVLAPVGGPAMVAELPIDPPLGVRAGLRRRSTAVDLSPGGVVCFYTDGLVERRDRAPDEGQARLRAAVTAGPPEQVCATVMTRMVGAEPPGDDIALLVLRRQARDAVSPLASTMPARPHSLRAIRAEVGRWLRAVGATPADIVDLQVAIGEACSNAVEHAYGATGGMLTVRLGIEESTVVAEISDAGSWRPERTGNNGRGLALIRELTDAARIEHRPGGTTVTIHRRLGR
ncbi:MAG TPA: SpoIIE family protein phosphatase [Mycobacteriales bacterium]|nr:SpoIIE family protein phosphatase [Mycobacteriales bacterium]